MVDPFAKDPEATVSPGAERARSDLEARFHEIRDGVGSRSQDGAAADGPSSRFGSQASRAANEARGAAASVVEQMRLRVAEIVDEQKAAGASRIAGVAQAAHIAAKDLDATNPDLARLVRSAAEGVDRIASDVRGRDLADVVDTIAGFGRRQPVAFFGGAVLTGFLLARFFKSDAPIVDPHPSAPV